jgi:hypothetical protein
MCRLIVNRAASVGREVAVPARGAEVKARGTVELDGAGVIADVENITIAVVGQETSGVLGVDLRATGKFPS